MLFRKLGQVVYGLNVRFPPIPDISECPPRTVANTASPRTMAAMRLSNQPWARVWLFAVLGLAGLVASYMAPHSTFISFGIAIAAIIWAAAAAWKKIETRSN